jgi:hypothetical protein
MVAALIMLLLFPASALHAVGQVSDLVPPFLFDFARSDAFDWRSSSRQGRGLSVISVALVALNSSGLPSWILSLAG